MNEEEARTFYEELVQLQEQHRSLQEHSHAIAQQLQNIRETVKTIDELGKVASPTDAWMAIAPGAYSKVTVQKPGTILLNVGANIAVEKTPAAVLKTLSEHELMLEQVREETWTELQQVIRSIERIKEQVEAQERGAAEKR